MQLPSLLLQIIIFIESIQINSLHKRYLEMEKHSTYVVKCLIGIIHHTGQFYFLHHFIDS